MEDTQGDLTVPLISALFCLSVIAGGILLCLWLLNEIDGNWVPITALILTGIPWVFWFAIYIYALAKYFLKSKNSKPHSGSTDAGPAKLSEVGMEEGGGNGNVSVANSKECELPLTLSAASC